MDADIPVRSSYDPMKQRRATQGGDIKAIPVPVKTGKISTPMAGGRLDIKCPDPYCRLLLSQTGLCLTLTV